MAFENHPSHFKITHKINPTQQIDLVELEPLDVLFMEPLPNAAIFVRKLMDEKSWTIPVLFDYAPPNRKLKTESCAIDRIDIPADTLIILQLVERLTDLKSLHERCPSFSDGWKISLDFLLELMTGSTSDRFILPDINGYREAIPDAILKLESEGPYTTAYFDGGVCATTCKPLAHFERVLDESKFCKLNNHTIVRENSIIDWNQQGETCAILCDGSEIPVAARRLPLFIEKMKQSSSILKKDEDE